MIHPGVQGEAERGEPRQTGPKVRLQQHMRPGSRAAVTDHRTGVPASRMAHAAESSTTGPQMRFEHRLDELAQRQIREAYDASSDARWPVEAAGAHRRNTSDELSFAYRAHLLRAAGTVHRVAFLE